MADNPASEHLSSKAAEFQATAEAFYTIAVEKVKDVRSSKVPGFVSIS